MLSPRRQLICIGYLSLFGTALLAAGRGPDPTPAPPPCTLWQDPVDLERRNLFYGPGGEAHQPTGTQFVFLSEDLDGSNPKFLVRDENGVKWKIKLGTETRPETVASRLVWAVGYTADEDYFLPTVQVKQMPGSVHRGRQWIEPDGTMQNVRVKRETDERKRLGEWQWRSTSAFRQLNGLRVLMAVINNWDLKDVNNGVLRPHGETSPGAEDVCEISDLGASFGSPGLERTKKSIGDLDDYRRSAFITRVTDDVVDFESPKRAAWIVLANPHEFIMRLRLRWLGRDIPRQDAKWMGQMLARLSPEQIRDAFRAAGYSQEDIDAYVTVLASRIAQLNGL